MSPDNKPLVAIVGPTAVGKSRLALHLAPEFDAEIVSADSRQVYRHFDIGTAKPTREEFALVPHHLIDIIDPDEDFSLAHYQQLASEAIDDVHRRGRLPLLVGGSGLYVRAVLEGWQIPRVPPDNEFRRCLERRAAEDGADRLYQELVDQDPEAARGIDPRNVRRVIRALEVSRQGLGASTRRRRRQAPPYQILLIGLTLPRPELYRRVDQRVDMMLEQGLVEEVRGLLDRGYRTDLPVMSGVGYRQIAMFLRGEISLEAAVERVKVETHRLVRHQYTWFRLDDERIRWFEARDDTMPEVEELLAGFLRGGPVSG